MIIERKIIKVGGSVGIMIPPDFLKHLDATEKDTVHIRDEEGKHGKYMTLWKKQGSEAP